MTKEQIEIDFSTANSAAGILEDAESLMNSADAQFDEYQQMLSVYWQGDAAHQYYLVTRHVDEKWKSRKGQLAEIREAIRNAARRIYEAEMKALEIAQKRDYGN